MNIRSVDAGSGWDWIRGGFGLFRQNPVIWIALFFIYLLVCMALSIVPVVGPIVLNLLAPVFMAGFMLGCQALESGEELEINHLFAGFKQNTSQLITVGGLYLAGIIMIVGLMFAMTGGAVLAMGQQGQAMGAAVSADMLPAALVALALFMGIYPKPILDVLHASVVHLMSQTQLARVVTPEALELAGALPMIAALR